MKTTVEIEDNLLRRAKRHAAARGMALKDLVDAGLRLALSPRPEKRKAPLKLHTFKGEGLQVEGDWAAIRKLIYEGRGE